MKENTIMEALKCSVVVTAGIIIGEIIPKYTRVWNFTQKELDNPPIYIDSTGAAMNYAMSLQNPTEVNWVKFEWVWL